MTPAIGSAAAGTQGIGAALAGGQPGAPLGADMQNQQLQQTTIPLVRQIAALNKQLAMSVPEAAAETQQIDGLLKQIMVKAAQAAQAQTASSLLLPNGSAGGM